MENRKKLSLPKSVLDMKFMKKTKDRLEKELDNIEGHHDLYADVITDEMRQASGNFISESSFIYCADLIEGRLSFNGVNPEIERLMELDKVEVNNGDMQKDVSDEVLAKKMGQFQRKRRSSPSKSANVKRKKY
ncbi:M-phase phosphoprotein 6 [Leptidea sinapis]|uniref:M-phase phosphoprotein 6 n=1 Tax=Leptidea sinapis TaxID=189913 RepID=A0A5E4QIJ0_9NEOP|nr:M-phase phosphoprotein 6 [Leptidea sinapis]VVC97372.1 unnamed protein product [Leptidea sinapis]